ncbi:glycoside hydrolase family 25 protein [Parasphingorhabdus sp.]|uniref:glycoside hydrolase family 25 protein n=1 Tax=Parasphingorhabdus sp. TaxID=2709688 RepID=UPI0026A93FBD
MANRNIRKTAFQLGLIAIALLVIAFVLRNIAIGWAPARDQYPVQGISVDESHGEIIWHVAGATGVDFAYIRATDGAEKRDMRFATNISAARDAGIRFGALHNYTLCRLASDQATMFVTTVPRAENMLPSAVRLAFDNGCNDRPGRALVLSELNTFLNQIEAHSGKPAIIAVSRDFEELYNISSGIDRTFWLEANFFPPDYATKPWVMWRASDIRRISGVDGPVNWNVVRP